MQLKLLLKQSFRDFVSKILLYFTFTLFLILAISVSLGMISFSNGFKSGFDETLGHDRVNALLTTDTFLPASMNETNPTKIKNYQRKEQKNDQGVGYLTQFSEDLINAYWPNEDKPNLDSERFERLLLGIGYRYGSTWNLYPQQIIKDALLTEKFGNDEAKRSQFNDDVNQLRLILLQKYQADNLITAFSIQEIKNNPDWTLGGFRNWFENLEMMNANGSKQNLFWEFLRTDSSMGKIDEDTPETLKITKTLTQKIWKEVDLKQEKYQEYLQDQRLCYVQPNFLPNYHHKVGDVIQLRITDWDNQTNPMTFENFLIAGTITFPDNLSIGRLPTFSLPYGYIEKTFQKWNEANERNLANSPPAYGSRIYFNIGSKNGDVTGGQGVADTFLNKIFANLKEPSEPLVTNTLWSKWDPAYSYEFTQTLFLIIAYIIGFVTLGLLFVVFYFITQQIVVLQRKTLFFLKAMGVKNSGLSLLTTFSMVVPMLVGTIVSIFGSLLIQEMMYRIAYQNVAFYQPYFSFNWTYFVTLIIIILLSVLIFYFINMFLINSKALTLEGMNSLKTNAKLFEKVKVKLSKTPAKLRIGLSFTFKNMYKNLISYLILSITFGIILFGTQFNSSLEVSSRAYEKWNKPYQSVNYATELNLFAPTHDTWKKPVESVQLENDETEEYVREYEKTSSLEGLQKISSRIGLYQAITAYRNSLDDPDSNFNWSNYYLDKAYVRDELDLIADNPEKYAEFINDLKNFIKENFPETDEQVIVRIVDLIDQVIKKYKAVRDQYNYHEGFTILMGRVFAPSQNRAVLSLASRYVKNNSSATMVAFEKNDWDSQKHFGFEDIENDDDFLIQGSYKEYDQDNQEWIIKKGSILKVNISSYFQSIQNIHRGDLIELEVNGLKSAENVHSSKVWGYVDKVLSSDTVSPTIYTSQVGLIKYLVAHLNEHFAEVAPQSSTEEDENLYQQKLVYEKLLESLTNDNISISNTAFDQIHWIPWGVRYITMPILHHTNNGRDEDHPLQAAGSRIEDFYDDDEFPSYLNSFGNNTMVFSEVTNRLLAKATPFNEALQKFVWILLAVSFAVSSILITLVLLENREVILLFKAMGYQKSEINWYLISGYFISAILATLTAALLALLVLKFASGAITQYLTTSINFVWSWQFILFAFGLAGAFCLAISVSIVVYTNLQKPRDAFALL